MDELRQVSYYGDNAVRIIAEAAGQQQPPLDYWIGALVYRISHSDFAVRLPAALFGAGSVVLFTLLARRAGNWGSALCLGGVLALLPFHIYYSQEARPYALPVFLLLALLLVLDRFLTLARPKLYHLPALLLVSVLFLLSRTLFPLVIVSTLVALLVGWTLLARISGEPLGRLAQRRRLGAAAMLSLAGTFYLPVFLGILAAGRRYATTGASIGQTLAAGVHRFDLRPLLHAWLAMADPLGWVLLPLVLAAPVLVLWLPELRERPAALIPALTLPGAVLLHLFAFQAETDFPFRPPYAAYALPMALVLCAALCSVLWRRLHTAAGGRIGAGVALALTAALYGYTARATLDFKALPKRTDWKGLSAYLASHYGPGDALVFDSLSASGDWEPNFYGFPRYYRGHSPHVVLSEVPLLGERLAVLAARPVLVLFQYRDYYLTRRSAYPVLPTPSGLQPAPLAKLLNDPRLELVPFTGLTVITLARPARGFAVDLLELLQILLERLPENSSLANLHVAAAALGKVCGTSGVQAHLEAGLRLTVPADKKTAIRRTLAALAQFRQACLGRG